MQVGATLTGARKHDERNCAQVYRHGSKGAGKAVSRGRIWAPLRAAAQVQPKLALAREHPGARAADLPIQVVGHVARAMGRGPWSSSSGSWTARTWP